MDIKIQNLSKSYKIFKRNPGLKAAIRSFVKRDFFLFHALKRFKDDLNDYSERFFRIVNEVPTVLVIIIVGLVVFKPNL